MNGTADPKVELEQLATLHSQAKARIAAAREYMVQLEERIAKLVGVKEEGSTTMRSATYKVTTTGGLNRVLEVQDPAYWRDQLGADFDDLLTEKLTLKTAAFRQASPDIQAKLMEHMVIKPKKVAVKVEAKEVD